MPYGELADLPENVRHHLPRHAQEIYLKAFNSAWDRYARPAQRRARASREATAHRVAWSAVEKVYEKGPDGDWRPR
jgi:cation transport regulator